MDVELKNSPYLILLMEKVPKGEVNRILSRNVLDSIPHKPRIPLPNYLLDLMERSDGKESSIYIDGAEKVIKSIWPDIIESGNRIKACGTLNIHPNSIYAYKNGEKGISIQNLYKLLNFWSRLPHSGIETVKGLWEEVYYRDISFHQSSSDQKVLLPKYINPKLSYFIGWFVGDGHYNQGGNHYVIKISEKSVPQLELVLKPLFRELFNLDPPIFRRYKGGFALQIGCKPLLRFIKNALEITVGEIPDLVYRLDDINKSYFLQGIVDSEGCAHNKRRRISITQSSEEFLIKIKRLFEQIGISCNGPIHHRGELGEWYTINIEGKQDYERFSKIVGSSHVEKLPRIANQVHA